MGIEMNGTQIEVEGRYQYLGQWVTVLEIDDDECYVQSDMGEVTTCFVCELEE